MTPERFSELRDLFDAALERAPHERSSWLLEVCLDQSLREDVERLLEAHELAEAGVTLSPPVSTAPSSPSAPLAVQSRVGQYEVLRELGRGGMGVVYLARRTDNVFSKPVAIKILKPEARDPELRRRFDQEREIVARLDHPNIARLLDGGTTEEGLPYSVIEYVDGQPIDVYCDERRLNVASRIALLCTVCHAVQYAHQHLVIHRDLKPSNILITPSGTVKLLDFGIAKLLESGSNDTLPAETVGLRPLTVAYASPEQIKGGRISTSADVYSLGVILYELLTGRRPYDDAGALPHVIQAICEEEPAPPSHVVPVAPDALERVCETSVEHLRRRLRGELDTIVMMALRKEPERRYGSVDKFREDLQRHLSGMPVLAQADSTAYRARKFVGRHRAGVAAAVLIVLSMTAAIAGTSWQARVARDERRRAEAEAAQARLQSERAERQTSEAERYRLQAEREAEFARAQLRLAEQREREASLERNKADRRGRLVQSMTQQLLALEANLPQAPGGTETGRRAVTELERALLTLRSEGFAADSLSQDAAAARERVQRYEALQANVTATTPPGWQFGSDRPDQYEHGLDRTYTAGGAAAFIKSRGSAGDGLATLLQILDTTRYTGRRLRVSALLRSNGISGSGGLLFQLFDEDRNFVGNHWNLTLRGTNEWAKHSVVFDVPDTSIQLAIGFALTGPGSIWADDFSIEVVDANTPVTRLFPSKPVDGGFDARKP